MVEVIIRAAFIVAACFFISGSIAIHPEDTEPIIVVVSK